MYEMNNDNDLRLFRDPVQCFTVCDLVSIYTQVPLSEHLTGPICPFGTCSAQFLGPVGTCSENYQVGVGTYDLRLLMVQSLLQM